MRRVSRGALGGCLGSIWGIWGVPRYRESPGVRLGLLRDLPCHTLCLSPCSRPRGEETFGV